MSTTTKPQLRRPGLKKPGIVIVQSLFLGAVTFLELWLRSGVGVVTGVAVLISFYGAVRFGRKGTEYVSVVTPPLVLVVAIFISLMILDHYRISRVAVDLAAALASAAPYLIIGAVYGWFVFLNAKFKARPSKARAL